MKDHYSTLGVARGATADDIKRAYRKLASQHHPDKGGDVKKFQEVEEAYRTLSNADSRAQYDNPSRPFNFQDSGGHPGGPQFNFNDIFEMFGAKFHSQGQQRQASARMALWIPLTDAVVGGRKPIVVSSPQGQNSIEIEIPPGIEDGESVRYQGLAPGNMDLIIQYRIRPEPGWERVNQNLTHDVTVTVWDLIMGRELKITTLDRTEISVVIPPMTQPGTMLRCRGHGVRSRNYPQGGDLLLKLHARLPSSISDELKEHIQREKGQ